MRFEQSQYLFGEPRFDVIVVRLAHMHQHAGSVFAYVLSGAMRSENSATGPVKVYKEETHEPLTPT